MKTLRLNRADSTAYANGERRFWRAMRKQPRVGIRGDGSIIHPEYLVWEDKGDIIPLSSTCMYRIVSRCPYGKPGDRIWLKATHDLLPHERTITAITIEQRNGRWGWLVEVGA
jgi:hypothetical protein